MLIFKRRFGNFIGRGEHKYGTERIHGDFDCAFVSEVFAEDFLVRMEQADFAFTGAVQADA
jgi:hypothetical protein